MKIVIIDDLCFTQYLESSKLEGGAQKTVLMEAHGMSRDHDVTFICSSKKTDKKLPFKVVYLDDYGALQKRILNYDNNGNKFFINKKNNAKHLRIIKETIDKEQPDSITINLGSSFSFYFIDFLLFELPRIPKIFIFHDMYYDLFINMNKLAALRHIKNNGGYVVANSNFTRNRTQCFLNYKSKYILSSAKSNFKNELYSLVEPEFSGTIACNKNDNFIDEVYSNFIYIDNNEYIPHENQNFSITIGRYVKNQDRLLDFHKYQNSYKIKLIGQKDLQWDSRAILHKKIINASNKYPDIYKVYENYSNDEKNEEIKHANNLVITSTREGFGYTAYECGLFGIPSIILNEDNCIHATSEYLTKVGASFIEINIQDKHYKEELYHTMKTYKLSLEEKQENINKFVNYFTLDNFIKNREDIIQRAHIKLLNTDNKIVPLWELR